VVVVSGRRSQHDSRGAPAREVTVTVSGRSGGWPLIPYAVISGEQCIADSGSQRRTAVRSRDEFCTERRDIWRDGGDHVVVVKHTITARSSGSAVRDGDSEVRGRAEAWPMGSATFFHRSEQCIAKQRLDGGGTALRSPENFVVERRRRLANGGTA